jgi:type II secretory pathway component PulJ
MNLQVEVIQTIAIYLTPVMLAIITYFLRSILIRFEKLEEKFQLVITKHEVLDRRLMVLEKDLESAEKRIEQMQHDLWKKQ